MTYSLVLVSADDSFFPQLSSIAAELKREIEKSGLTVMIDNEQGTADIRLKTCAKRQLLGMDYEQEIIMVCDAGVLHERYSCVNAKSYFNVQQEVIALMIPNKRELLSHEHASLQFSPCCYVQYYPKHDYRVLVTYIINRMK